MRALTRSGNRAPRRVTVGMLGALTLLSTAAIPARADSPATDVVTTCNGSGPGSLPATVDSALPGDTIAFAVSCPSSTPITLASTIVIDTDLSIDGPGPNAMVVSGNNAVQIFDIASGVVSISGLTLEEGQADSDVAGGGAILNGGTLSISDSDVTNNSAYSFGGGIFNWSTLTMTDSVVSDNAAESGDGGGIDNFGGTLNITDSTLAGNSADFAGGGIANDNSSYGQAGGATLNLSDSTLSGNSADWGGGLGNGFYSSATLTHATVSGNGAWSSGGGIYTSVAATVNASIVTGNSITSPYYTQTWADCYLNGTTIVGSYDIDDDGSCGFSPYGDTAPGLDPAGLQNNGGPTPTIALEPDSVGVRAVDSAALCSTSDQRGVARPTPCDIGAFEYAVTDLPQTITFSTKPANAFVGSAGYVVSASASSDLPVTLLVPPPSDCSVAGVDVTFTSAGTCQVDAEQSGNQYYAPAPVIWQNFPVAPECAISSPDVATATEGQPFAFSVTTIGTTVRSVAKDGALPKGLKFRPKGDGTATLSGTPRTPGVYNVTITAVFGKGHAKTVLTQAFTLTVAPG
jgi:hypothetical protein